MPPAAPSTIHQIGDTPNLHTTAAATSASRMRLNPIPRVSPRIGATISATTAGRIPLKAASTTRLCRISVKNKAISRMMTNEGITTPKI